ncbi:MAG: 5-formyltetrahydrofolate cyclo-ligase [Thermoplasmata archaeon]|nr:MAG: 5-formyltetrahydrofolate cyclo-ligase [Thermoplasmata archaeon]
MGKPSIQQDKDSIRKTIYDLLVSEGVARFPLPPHGRIPNFEGAEMAASQLKETTIWQAAHVLKCNPDSPQRAVRENALKEGKTIYMAVPRLREVRCFIELHKGRIFGGPSKGATIKGAFKYGKKVGPEHMRKVDMVIAGSVAVDVKGGRVGKGGGYSDLEYALGREFGLVDDDTPVVSTVHPLQVVEDELLMTPHDVPLDLVITPKRVIETPKKKKPNGILWEELNEDKIAAIPILKTLRSPQLGK